jgi:hypothetical protein
LLLLLAPTAGRAADPLAELGWLVGDWTADLAPPKGDPLTVNVSYSWAIHRKSFDYAIVFKTKDGEVAQYAGHFYWHPGAKEIRMLQIDRGGQVTEATLTAAGDGKWTQKNRLTRADGSTQEQRAELTRLGDDTFLFRAFVPKGDEWVEGLKVQYRRVKTPPKK